MLMLSEQWSEKEYCCVYSRHYLRASGDHITRCVLLDPPFAKAVAECGRIYRQQSINHSKRPAQKRQGRRHTSAHISSGALCIRKEIYHPSFVHHVPELYDVAKRCMLHSFVKRIKNTIPCRSKSQTPFSATKLSTYMADKCSESPQTMNRYVFHVPEILGLLYFQRNTQWLWHTNAFIHHITHELAWIFLHRPTHCVYIYSRVYTYTFSHTVWAKTTTTTQNVSTAVYKQHTMLLLAVRRPRNIHIHMARAI